ncbi:MAG: elongation factor P maturation arginine rhamnosyltransferase EarP [Proteobacteria bacterium]|nr:elongation factor P maturation arginine rhamnosyltransferase EarP [Pseudomonadota bacterium]
MGLLRWDLFCRVIDNHGDLGVCWRLARDLAARGDTVRLVVDDARALAWMAPQGAAGVEVLPWSDAPPANVGDVVGDVVVEAFGCDPPPAFVDAMARRRPPPVWINLEYLSAEAYVERSHGLPSPQSNGLHKWFFYPGFTPRTGGLLRESALLQQQEAFDRQAWLAAHGWAPRPGERVASLFSYALPRLADWLPVLAAQPTLLLAAPGPAVAPLRALPLPPGLRVIELPWLTQPDYDRLLWSCDLNAVRGEDSFVRAQWAAAPLLWQIYPQHDGAHAPKLEAWLDRCLDGAPPSLALAVRRAQRQWNGLDAGAPALPELPDLAAWRAWQQAWRQRLLAQHDLTTELRRFALEKAGKP